MNKPYRLLDGMPYTPAVKTNVQDTWRRFGWKPIAESLNRNPSATRSMNHLQDAPSGNAEAVPALTPKE